MRVNLYLHKDTFAYNGHDTRGQLVNKLRCLVDDLSKIRSCDGNNDPCFYVSSTLQDTRVYDQEDILSLSSDFGHEEKDLLYSILWNTSEECDNDLDDLKAKSKYTEGETECNTIVYLNAPAKEEAGETKDDNDNKKADNGKKVFTEEEKVANRKPYMQFDNYEIIYDIQSWQTLERQILGNHPDSAEHLFSECKRLFPMLFFHDNCKSTLKDVYDKVPRQIVCHLACMNDKLKDYYDKVKNRQANDILQDFAGKYNLSEGSLNRNKEFKVNLTFSFPSSDKKNPVKSIYCDPHFKLDEYDSNYKKKKDDAPKPYARIYFSFGDKDVAGGRVLVGWIGKHA